MFEIINLIVNTITAIAAVLAVVFAKKTLTQQQREQKEGLDREKKQATLDAYNRLQEQAFDKINIYKPAEIRDICRNRRSEEYKVLSSYIARIEHFCVGVKQGIYDIETFYELAEGYFNDPKGLLYPRISPIIDRKQEDAEKDYFENIHYALDALNQMKIEKAEY